MALPRVHVAGGAPVAPAKWRLGILLWAMGISVEKPWEVNQKGVNLWIHLVQLYLFVVPEYVAAWPRSVLGGLLGQSDLGGLGSRVHLHLDGPGPKDNFRIPRSSKSKGVKHVMFHM